MLLRLRATAFLTLLTFSLNTVGAVPVGAGMEGAAPRPRLEVPAFEIPSGLGTLTEFHVSRTDFREPSAENQVPGPGLAALGTRDTAPFLIHIQTAHGDYAVQKKVEALLHYLTGHYGIRRVLVEGSGVKLDPELDRFFPRSDWNRAVNELRAKNGLATGVGLFLLEALEKGRPVDAYGIESVEAYRKNRLAFQSLLHEREKAAPVLSDWERKMERYFAGVLSKPLRDFLVRESAFEAKNLPFVSWFRELRRLARKELGIALNYPSFQKEWPALYRLAGLGRIESRLDAQEVEKEKKKFLSDARRLLTPELFGEVKEFLSAPGARPYAHVRFLVERVVDALPPGFSFDRYPSFKTWLTLLVYQNEIRPESLFRELKRLSLRIREKLARSEKERKAVSLYEDYALLKRLLAAELTPEDYEQIVGARFIAPAGSIHGAPTHLFNLALEFYRGAKEREAWMAANTVEQVTAAAGGENAILITGGFHAEGLKQAFLKKNIPYALVTPKVEAAAEERKNYYNSFLDRLPLFGGYPDPLKETLWMGLPREFSFSEIEDGALLPIPFSELRSHGISRRFVLGSRLAAIRAFLGPAPRGGFPRINRSRFIISSGIRVEVKDGRLKVQERMRSESGAAFNVPTASRERARAEVRGVQVQESTGITTYQLESEGKNGNPMALHMVMGRSPGGRNQLLERKTPDPREQSQANLILNRFVRELKKIAEEQRNPSLKTLKIKLRVDFAIGREALIRRLNEEPSVDLLILTSRLNERIERVELTQFTEQNPKAKIYVLRNTSDLPWNIFREVLEGKIGLEITPLERLDLQKASTGGLYRSVQQYIRGKKEPSAGHTLRGDRLLIDAILKLLEFENFAESPLLSADLVFFLKKLEEAASFQDQDVLTRLRSLSRKISLPAPVMEALQRAISGINKENQNRAEVREEKEARGFSGRGVPSYSGSASRGRRQERLPRPVNFPQYKGPLVRSPWFLFSPLLSVDQNGQRRQRDIKTHTTHREPDTEGLSGKIAQYPRDQDRVARVQKHTPQRLALPLTQLDSSHEIYHPALGSSMERSSLPDYLYNAISNLLIMKYGNPVRAEVTRGKKSGGEIDWPERLRQIIKRLTSLGERSDFLGFEREMADFQRLKISEGKQTPTIKQVPHKIRLMEMIHWVKKALRGRPLDDEGIDGLSEAWNIGEELKSADPPLPSDKESFSKDFSRRGWIRATLRGLFSREAAHPIDESSLERMVPLIEAAAEKIEIPDRILRKVKEGSRPELLNLAVVASALMAKIAKEMGLSEDERFFSSMSLVVEADLFTESPGYSIWRPSSLPPPARGGFPFPQVHGLGSISLLGRLFPSRAEVRTEAGESGLGRAKQRLAIALFVDRELGILKAAGAEEPSYLQMSWDSLENLSGDRFQNLMTEYQILLGQTGEKNSAGSVEEAKKAAERRHGLRMFLLDLVPSHSTQVGIPVDSWAREIVEGAGLKPPMTPSDSLEMVIADSALLRLAIEGVLRMARKEIATTPPPSIEIKRASGAGSSSGVELRLSFPGALPADLLKPTIDSRTNRPALFDFNPGHDRFMGAFVWELLEKLKASISVEPAGSGADGTVKFIIHLLPPSDFVGSAGPSSGWVLREEQIRSGLKELEDLISGRKIGRQDQISLAGALSLLYDESEKGKVPRDKAIRGFRKLLKQMQALKEGTAARVVDSLRLLFQMLDPNPVGASRYLETLAWVLGLRAVGFRWERGPNSENHLLFHVAGREDISIEDHGFRGQAQFLKALKDLPDWFQKDPAISNGQIQLVGKNGRMLVFSQRDFPQPDRLEALRVFLEHAFFQNELDRLVLRLRPVGSKTSDARGGILPEVYAVYFDKKQKEALEKELKSRIFPALSGRRELPPNLHWVPFHDHSKAPPSAADVFIFVPLLSRAEIRGGITLDPELPLAISYQTVKIKDKDVNLPVAFWVRGEKDGAPALVRMKGILATQRLERLSLEGTVLAMKYEIKILSLPEILKGKSLLMFPNQATLTLYFDPSRGNLVGVGERQEKSVLLIGELMQQWMTKQFNEIKYFYWPNPTFGIQTKFASLQMSEAAGFVSKYSSGHSSYQLNPDGDFNALKDWAEIFVWAQVINDPETFDSASPLLALAEKLYDGRFSPMKDRALLQAARKILAPQRSEVRSDPFGLSTLQSSPRSEAKAEVRAEPGRPPVGVLIADPPDDPGTVASIQERLTNSLGDRVVLYTPSPFIPLPLVGGEGGGEGFKTGIGKDKDVLRRFIEEHRPTAVVIRSDTKAFMDPDFVKWAASQGVRLILRMGVGVDNVDLKAADEAGISVARTRGNAKGVGAGALLFFLAGLTWTLPKDETGQDISGDQEWGEIFSITPPESEAALKSSSKKGRGDILPEHRKKIFSPISLARGLQGLQGLNGQTIGLVGFGDTAQDTARRLALTREKMAKRQVHFKIMATSPGLDAGEARRVKAADRLGVLHPGEKEVLAQADTLIFQNELKKGRAGETPKPFDLAKLAQSPKVRLIINTAREGVIDPAVWPEFFARPGSLYLADIDLAVNGAPIDSVQPFLTKYKDQTGMLPHIFASTKTAARGIEEKTIPALEAALMRLLGQETDYELDIVNQVLLTPLRAEVRDGEETKTVHVINNQELEIGYGIKLKFRFQPAGYGARRKSIKEENELLAYVTLPSGTTMKPKLASSDSVYLRRNGQIRFFRAGGQSGEERQPLVKVEVKKINRRSETARIIIHHFSEVRNNFGPETTRYFNNFLGRSMDMAFRRDDLHDLVERFGQLTDEGEYAFPRSLLRRLSRDKVLARGFPRKMIPRALMSRPRFISINGSVTVDISVIFQPEKGNQFSWNVEDVLITPATTGPVAARVLAGLGDKTLLYGYADEVVGRAFSQALEVQEETGLVDLLRGPSRANIYLFVPDPAHPHAPPRQMGLKTPRQALTKSRGLRLLKYVERKLMDAAFPKAYVILGAQIIHRAPPEIIQRLIQISKSKGYQVAVDFKPDLRREEILGVLESSPSVIKPNLEELALIEGVSLKEFLAPFRGPSRSLKRNMMEGIDAKGRPKFHEIAKRARNLGERYDIDEIIVTLGKYGVLVAYRTNEKRYEVIRVRAPILKVKASLSAGDATLAGFIWKRSHGGSIEDSAIYAVASGSASVQRPGADVETKKEEIESMVRRMKAEWGKNLITKFSTAGWAPGLPGGLSRSTRPGPEPRASGPSLPAGRQGQAQRGPLTRAEVRKRVNAEPAAKSGRGERITDASGASAGTSSRPEESRRLPERRRTTRYKAPRGEKSFVSSLPLQQVRKNNQQGRKSHADLRGVNGNGDDAALDDTLEPRRQVNQLQPIHPASQSSVTSPGAGKETTPAQRYIRLLRPAPSLWKDRRLQKSRLRVLPPRSIAVPRAEVRGVGDREVKTGNEEPNLDYFYYAPPLPEPRGGPIRSVTPEPHERPFADEGLRKELPARRFDDQTTRSEARADDTELKSLALQVIANGSHKRFKAEVARRFVEVFLKQPDYVRDYAKTLFLKTDEELRRALSEMLQLENTEVRNFVVETAKFIHTREDILFLHDIILLMDQAADALRSTGKKSNIDFPGIRAFLLYLIVSVREAASIEIYQNILNGLSLNRPVFPDIALNLSEQGGPYDPASNQAVGQAQELFQQTVRRLDDFEKRISRYIAGRKNQRGPIQEKQPPPAGFEATAERAQEILEKSQLGTLFAPETLSQDRELAHTFLAALLEDQVLMSLTPEDIVGAIRESALYFLRIDTVPDEGHRRFLTDLVHLTLREQSRSEARNFILDEKRQIRPAAVVRGERKKESGTNIRSASQASHPIDLTVKQTITPSLEDINSMINSRGATILLKLQARRPAPLRQPWLSIFRTASEVRAFLPEDVADLGIIFTNLVGTPEAAAAPAPESFTGLGRRAQAMALSHGYRLPDFGFTAESDSKFNGTMGVLLSFATFQKYGPALAILQNHQPELRFAVMSEGTSEDISVQKGIVRDLNRSLKPRAGQILVYSTPTEAALSFQKKVSYLEGIGLDPRTAALISRFVPRFTNQGEQKLVDFISGVPGLAALLERFSREAQRALDTAA